MRNLLEYPITKDEILQFLRDINTYGYEVPNKYDPPIGSLDPSLLEAAYTIVKESNERFFNLDRLKGFK